MCRLILSCDFYRLDVRPLVVLTVQLLSLLINKIAVLQRFYMFRLKSQTVSV
jgi:hypothetical protein